MIHGFYFRFYRMTHCKLLSVVLANMVYFIFFCMYCVERLSCKKRIVMSSKETALDVISKVHPDPKERPKYKNVDVDNGPDLSIIIPVYNNAELIENNIPLIINQKTEYKYELILVDDGSTDGAQDVLRRYEGHAGVKVIFQENQGIAGARNTGLDNATGRYVMFVDCDDAVEDNLVEVLLARAYHDNCDIVMCAHNLVKVRNGEVYEIVPNVYPEFNMLGYSENAKILNYAGLPWCKVYKRELWKNVRFFPGYWYEDSIIHSLLFTQCSKFIYEPVICYQYRWYEKNFSHTQNDKADSKCIDMYWMMIPILEQYEKMGLPKDERFETMLLKHLSAYYYNKMCGLDDDIVDALFILACDLYKQYRIKKTCKLPYMLRVTQKALQEGDINLWKLAIKYQK